MSDKQNASKNSTDSNSTKTNDFKPYIPTDQSVAEFTVTSVITGIILESNMVQTIGSAGESVVAGALAATAFAIGGILILLDKAYGFGSKTLSAPQASL